MVGCRFGRDAEWKEIEAGARAVVEEILNVVLPASELLDECAAHLVFFLSQSATHQVA